MALEQKQRVLIGLRGLVLGEQLHGAICLEPGPAAIWRVAVVDRGGEDPAVGAGVEHVVGVIGAGGRSQHEMNTGKSFGRPLLELFLAQGGSAEDVRFQGEAEIAQTGLLRIVTACVERQVEIGDDQRHAAGAAPEIHDPRDDNGLREHVRAELRNAEVLAALNGRDRGGIADIVERDPAVLRSVEIVSCLAGMGGLGAQHSGKAACDEGGAFTSHSVRPLNDVSINSTSLRGSNLCPRF